MLKVSQLTKEYEPGVGINNFNLTMSPGDVVLLLGPNGAGKTTAIKGILGLSTINDGSIVYDDIDTKDHLTEFLSSVGACVSEPCFYEYLSGFENLNIYSKFYKHVDKDRIEKVLDIVELTLVKDKVVSKYSSGMKQRLDFARAILHEPKLLFLDEPFNGMDIEKKADLKAYLKAVSQNNDASILISSHMVGDFEQLANRVLILYDGRCLFEGSMKTVIDRGTSLEDFYLKVIEDYKQFV